MVTPNGLFLRCASLSRAVGFFYRRERDPLERRSGRKESGEMSVSAPETRKWVVLGATLATMLGCAMAFGETPTPCQEAYLMSGLSEQQMIFEEFGEFYADTLCSSEQQEEV
jgi:hypothetical protein